MYLGSWKIDDTLTFTCNTHTPATSAAVDADAVPGYRIYEDETTTPILTGSMAKLDDANTTGFYSEQITLSAANGLEKGKSYNIRITGVVDGVTGVKIDTFQIEAEVDANVVSDKTGFSLAADQSGVTIGTVTTNTDMRGTDSANTTVPDAAGTAATLHGITDGKVDAVQSDATAIKAVTDVIPDAGALTDIIATLGQIKGAVAGTKWVSVDEDQVKIYDSDDNLLATLDKTTDGSNNVTWTATWA